MEPDNNIAITCEEYHPEDVVGILDLEKFYINLRQAVEEIMVDLGAKGVTKEPEILSLDYVSSGIRKAWKKEEGSPERKAAQKAWKAQKLPHFRVNVFYDHCSDVFDDVVNNFGTTVEEHLIVYLINCKELKKGIVLSVHVIPS